jgi:nucleotide-binding universal stress UspA family protein
MEGFLMSFKTILAIIGIDQSSADLVAAAALAEASGAHLNAIVMTFAPPPPVGDVGGLGYVAWGQNWQDDNKRLEARAASLRSELVATGASFEVEPVFSLRSYGGDEIARRGRFADVTLLGAELGIDAPLLRHAIDGGLLQSPGPVILAPRNRAVDLAPNTVLVAWNGGLEAGRAVRHALPMLVGAEAVHIAVVDPQATRVAMGEEPGLDIAEYLARHGVKATVDVLASGGGDAGAVLRQHATDLGAQMIVMGGYGHSRLRERMFGGVTQSMLDNPQITVLLAH